MNHSDRLLPLPSAQSDTASSSAPIYTSELTDRWQAKVVLIFIGVFALYFFTRSPGLDEWDSVQFALGVRDFNIWAHQPHPPGYPLYIFAGWISHVLFGWDPVFSLLVANCLGGALFVSAWFLIIRLQFGEKFSWLITVSLAFAPIVWMTSTKVLTDSLAAGLLSAQLFFALLYRRDGQTRKLIAASIVGAAATGVRPQLFPIAAIVLIIPLLQRHASRKLWCAGFIALIVGCLLWLLPMWYLQAKIRPDLPVWTVYPRQLYVQWQWRLDKPKVFIGASDFSPKYLGQRLAYHVFGWFGLGLGFMRSGFTLAAGGLLALWGIATYLIRLDKKDRQFWKAHRVWAGLHIVIIFCCLPAHQRYYLIILPLLLVVIVRGLLQLPTPWSQTAWLMPALLLFISIPLAIRSHGEEAPPLKVVRFLERRYAPQERKDVLLILGECRRHVPWYAPEFTSVVNTETLATVDATLLTSAKAIYTDDPALILPPDWKLVRVALFHRSLLIDPKHHKVGVYQVEHVYPEDVGEQRILKQAADSSRATPDP